MFTQSWLQTVSLFLEAYPEFKPYAHVAPIVPIQRIPYQNINNLFEAVMHYVCAIGVRYSYAFKQWEYIYPLISSELTWDTICYNAINILDDDNIQPKKRRVYLDICNYMNEHGITHDNLTIIDLEDMRKNVNGIGDGCVAFCKRYFTMDDDCMEYTDIHFKKGFMKLYGTDKLSEIKKKCQEWKSRYFGRVANLFILNLNL
jgi:3-methyladenine DNA glycosylase/8-oxoguanine DNA glycosylase